jgi:hypothetical protein
VHEISERHGAAAAQKIQTLFVDDLDAERLTARSVSGWMARSRRST